MTLHAPADVSTDLTDAIAAYTQLGELLRVIADVATGYRTYLVDQGWPDDVAIAAAGQALGAWQAGVLR